MTNAKPSIRAARQRFPISQGFKALFLVFLAVSSSLAQAEWTLDNDRSTLSFVTTKAVDVGEVHIFDTLSGSVDEAGAASLIIDLASINTNIPIRDERMQTMLFDTKRFPVATLTAQVPIASLSKLNAGEMESLPLKGQLTIRGLNVDVLSDVAVIRLADGSLRVNSLKPLLINARDVDLLEGIERLREVAGLPSIGQSVAVSFQLTFNPN